jgi:hypothetical protein
MALETGSFISDLNSSNPQSTDSVSQADDHIRLIKSTVKATFPNVTGAVTVTQTQINDVVNKAPIASPTFTGVPAGPTASSSTNTTQLATTAFVQAVAQATKSALYPVGAIFINATNSTNPATLLGFGTWAAFGAGRVMVGHNASDPLFDTAEETGGSKDAVVVSHTHTATSTVSDPGHSHTASTGNNDGSPAGGFDQSTNTGTGTVSIGANTTGITVSTSISSTGSSGTNANLQPYITVYMWKRTA